MSSPETTSAPLRVTYAVELEVEPDVWRTLGDDEHATIEDARSVCNKGGAFARRLVEITRKVLS